MLRAGSVRFVRDAPVNGPSSSRPAAAPAQAIFWGGAGSPAAEAPFSFQDFPLDALLGRNSAESQALPQPLVPMQVTSYHRESLRLMVLSWTSLVLLWHSFQLSKHIQQHAYAAVCAGAMAPALCHLRYTMLRLACHQHLAAAGRYTKQDWVAEAPPGPQMFCCGCILCMLVQRSSTVFRDANYRPVHSCRRTHQAG